MEGLETYFGNIVSQHADRHLDMVGIGRLFAMSRRPALNALACLRYRAEFGRNAVFALRTPEEKHTSGERTLVLRYRCRRLFGENVSSAKLANLLDQGAVIRSTLLTRQFGFDAYLNRQTREVVPLFALDEKKLLRVFTAESELQPSAGWTVTSVTWTPAPEGDATRGGERHGIAEEANLDKATPPAEDQVIGSGEQSAQSRRQADPG
jgi:hypothetical protein